MFDIALIIYICLDKYYNAYNLCFNISFLD